MEKSLRNIIETGTIDGFEYWIAKFPSDYKGELLNGYVVFPKRPVRELSYDGILTYVPVHGGITYAREYDGGMVYGFDTGHCDSHEFPINDKEWIKGQIKTMSLGILKASEVERNYLRCTTNQGKAKQAQAVQDVGAPEHRQNFGVNINLLSGKL